MIEDSISFLCQKLPLSNSRNKRREDRASGDRRERTLNDLLCADGYWCVVCGRYLPTDDDGVIVHDDVPHPDMTFDEEEKPQ